MISISLNFDTKYRKTSSYDKSRSTIVLNLAKVPLFPTNRSRKTIVVVLPLRLSLWSDDKESICERKKRTIEKLKMKSSTGYNGRTFEKTNGPRGVAPSKDVTKNSLEISLVAAIALQLQMAKTSLR